MLNLRQSISLTDKPLDRLEEMPHDISANNEGLRAANSQR